MTTALGTNAVRRRPMEGMRKTALVAGIFYLITFVSLPAVVLLHPVLYQTNFILGSGSDTRVLLGCFLYFITALAGIGTAVTLFPVVKRQNETVALGFVASRVLEGSILVIGTVSLLAVVALRQNLGAMGTDHASLVAVGQALVHVRDWTFVLGDSFMPGVNALLLGYLMYRSGLVPRLIPALGLIGAPLLFISATATLFRGGHQVTALAGIAGLLIALWELSLGLWLTFKGFNRSPVLPQDASPEVQPI